MAGYCVALSKSALRRGRRRRYVLGYPAQNSCQWLRCVQPARVSDHCREVAPLARNLAAHAPTGCCRLWIGRVSGFALAYSLMAAGLFAIAARWAALYY